MIVVSYLKRNNCPSNKNIIPTGIIILFILSHVRQHYRAIKTCNGGYIVGDDLSLSLCKNINTLNTQIVILYYSLKNIKYLPFK